MSHLVAHTQQMSSEERKTKKGDCGTIKGEINKSNSSAGS